MSEEAVDPSIEQPNTKSTFRVRFDSFNNTFMSFTDRQISMLIIAAYKCDRLNTKRTE
jgi:ribosomal protein S11